MQGIPVLKLPYEWLSLVYRFMLTVSKSSRELCRSSKMCFADLQAALAQAVWTCRLGQWTNTSRPAMPALELCCARAPLFISTSHRHCGPAAAVLRSRRPAVITLLAFHFYSRYTILLAAANSESNSQRLRNLLQVDYNNTYCSHCTAARSLRYMPSSRS